MKKEREVRGYCVYCKSVIYKDEAYTKAKDGTIFHPFCYNQENSYTDDFGTYVTDEFGEVNE